MTRSCCRHCGLRFSPEAVRDRTACPFCAEPLTPASAEQALGLRLVALTWLRMDDAAVECAMEERTARTRPAEPS
jgi:hypothetical protein